MKTNRINKSLIWLILMIAGVSLISCEEDRDEYQVTYMVTDAVSEVAITWYDQNASLSESVAFESMEDEWKYSFTAQEGDLLYLSSRYQDSTGSVKNIILVDGKLYKEGSTSNDPGQYLIVSGTIPYDEK